MACLTFQNQAASPHAGPDEVETLRPALDRDLVGVAREHTKDVAHPDVMPSIAEFDPREHEGVGRQASAEVPEGHVLHVVRQGYRKGDRVIRPAQVIIATRPDD